MPATPFGKMTAAPNTKARFRITPITAAVTPVKAPVRFLLPRKTSIYGAPINIEIKHGRNKIQMIQIKFTVTIKRDFLHFIAGEMVKQLYPN